VNVLVLGGTRFVGRHIVERLARDGHRVVCFHRGQTQCSLPSGVEERYGDRNADLSAVDTERWDAIVDTSGFRAEQLERSLVLRTERYLFISTLNVYRDLASPGVSEEAATIDEVDPSDVAANYGGNKAACERLLMDRYPQRHIIVRPGLIAGRWDNSGRCTYWCERFLRGGPVLAPGAPSRLIQFIDAADIAQFAEHALSRNVFGVFNIAGPAEPTTMAQFLRECAAVAAERGAPPATVVWADDEFLLQHGVGEWVEMPLWLTDTQFAGILEVSNAKALAAGLDPGAIAETVRSVLDWISEDAVAVPRVGISAQRERELLASVSSALGANP
jgi:2'-hydroxyisoflavone reductase